MKALGLRVRVAATGALLVAFLVLTFAMLQSTVRELGAAGESAKRSDAVIAAAYALQNDAVEMQTSGRGYVITGGEAFLDPLRTAQRRLPDDARRLTKLVADNPLQRGRAAEVAARIDSYSDRFAIPLVETARRDRAEAARMIRSGEGKRRLDAIRRIFGELISTERALERERSSRKTDSAARAELGGAVAMAVSVLVILALVVLMSRTVVSPLSRAAGAARRLAGGDLSARVPERGAGEARELARSFNAMALSLQENRDELESQNAELEAQQGELEYAVEELGRQKEGIEALHRFGELVSGETDLRPLAKKILEQLCDIAESEAGTLYATDGESEPALLAARGVSPDGLPQSLSAGEGLAGRVLVERRTLRADAGEVGLRAATPGKALRHELHVPLIHAGQTFGVLTLGRLADRPFPRSESVVVEYMAGQSAVALSNALALARARDQATINRAVLETAHDAFISINSAGYITGWNSKAEETFGWSAAEAIGRELADTIVPEELRERHRRGLARFAETGEGRVIGRRLELTALHRDGHVFPVEMTVSPVEVGGALVLNAFLHDISDRRRQEREVKRLAEIVESADEAIVSVDLDGVVTSWNPGAERALGWSAAEMLGASADRTMPADRREHEYRLFGETILAGETLTSFETRRVRSDGTEIDVSITVSPLRDTDGRINGASLIGTDVSERKRLERKSGRLFSVSLDLMCTIGFDGYLKELNPAWSESLGWSEEELLSRPVADLMHPDDLERTIEEYRRLEHGDELMNFENRYRSKDGEWRWLRWTCRVSREEALFYAVARDVTDEKRKAAYAEAQHAVTGVLARARTLDEATAGVAETLGRAMGWQLGAFWMLDESGERLRCSGLWHAPELENEPFVAMSRELALAPGDGLPGHVWEQARTLWFDARGTEKSRFPRFDAGVDAGMRGAIGVPVIGKSGVTGVLEFFHSRVREPDADLLAMLSGLSGQVGQFVERKRAEAEAERLKDEFFALVSHELRTPLSAIIGYLELVEEDELENLSPEGQRFLGVIDRNAHRLLRLVGDLLFVAQVEAGKLALEPGRIDLRELVADSVETARPHAEEKRIRLTLDTESFPSREGDPDRIGQALDNLISNAVKFTPEGGRVHVSAHAADGEAVIEVRDSGIGIPAGEQEQLFQRFFRASSAVQQAIPGVGLGLTIAAAIVEAHGGRIGLDSAEGSGTTFRVHLPLDAGKLLETAPSADYVS